MKRYLLCVMSRPHFQPPEKFVSQCHLVWPVSFHLDDLSHLAQMSFTLFSDNDNIWTWRERVVCVASVRVVILHWWCSAECETGQDERADKFGLLLAACTRILQVFTPPECTLQLTTAPPSSRFIVSSIHRRIQWIRRCRNYAHLNQSKQAERMKSSEIVALIIPIRFLPSSLPLFLRRRTASTVEWVVASGWTMIDRSLLFSGYAKWAASS